MKKKMYLLTIVFVLVLFVGPAYVNAAVSAKKPSINLNKTKATIYTKGTKTVQLKATVKGTKSKVKWTSSKKSVASVDSKGKVTAKKVGTATIYAKVSGVTAQCKITVKTKKPSSANEYKCISASSEIASERTVGGVKFSYESRYINGLGRYGSLYYTNKGQKKLLVNMMGLDSTIVTNGKKVFFYSCEKGKANVYSKKLSSTKNTKLFSISMEEYFELAGMYDGNLYYIKNLDPGKLCKYSLSTKQHKGLVANTTHAKQKNQYFYLTPYQGDLGPLDLRIYNAKTGKTTLITKNMCSYYLIGDYIYYEEFCNPKECIASPYAVSIKRCKLDGSGKKTLINSIKVNYVKSITSKKIIYIDEYGNQKEKSF